MKSEIKEKWLIALRSGDYSQTSGWLRDDKGFCCLGVLCDVIGVEWEPSHNKNIDRYHIIDVDGISESSMLPLGIELEVDLNREVQSKLANMNDQGAKFRAIADWIEENL